MNAIPARKITSEKPPKQFGVDRDCKTCMIPLSRYNKEDYCGPCARKEMKNGRDV